MVQGDKVGRYVTHFSTISYVQGLVLTVITPAITSQSLALPARPVLEEYVMSHHLG